MVFMDAIRTAFYFIETVLIFLLIYYLAKINRKR